MKPPSALSTRQLLASERYFLGAMRELGFGRFESLQIEASRLLGIGRLTVYTRIHRMRVVRWPKKSDSTQSDYVDGSSTFQTG